MNGRAAFLRRPAQLVLALAALAGVWTLGWWREGGYLVPAPWDVVRAFYEEWPNGLAGHFVASARRVLLAMGLASLLAMPLGLAMGQSRRLNGVLSPLVYLTYPIPKVVFLPIVLLVLGIGDRSKVFLIALILFFQVLLVVRDAASVVRAELVQSVASLGAGRWQLFRYVYFPASVPAILTSLRVSTGTAVAVLFLAETFATQDGLGYYIMVDQWGRLAYTQMYAGVLAMSLLGMAIYVALDQAERRLCRWAHLSH